MKILVLANNLLGLYSFRKEVMKAFVDRGDEVIISAPLDDKAPDVEKLGCKIIATEFNRQRSVIYNIRRSGVGESRKLLVV